MNEDWTIWTFASIRKFIKQVDPGVPVEYLQQGNEPEPRTHPARVQLLISGPDFMRVGSRNEVYAVVKLDVHIESDLVDNDIYYHTRIKARFADIMSRTIPIYKIGSPEYDKSSAGVLRPQPTESIIILPTGLKKPDSTLITQFYLLEKC